MPPSGTGFSRCVKRPHKKPAAISFRFRGWFTDTQSCLVINVSNSSGAGLRNGLPSLPDHLTKAQPRQQKLSLVLASLATTGASIFAAFLDGMVLDEQAILPSLMNKWLQEGKDEGAIMCIRRRRHVLDYLILAFAD